MLLNSIKPATGARQTKKRLGRGIGSGLGKTAGRGHKGQKARAGGYHKVGFEGGQMPIQRRVPKLGFRSHIARSTRQIRLSEIEKLEAAVIDLSVLKDANLVPKSTKYVKIFASGEISRAVTIKGLRVTRGAQSAIEAVGGKVE